MVLEEHAGEIDGCGWNRIEMDGRCGIEAAVQVPYDGERRVLCRMRHDCSWERKRESEWEERLGRAGWVS